MYQFKPGDKAKANSKACGDVPRGLVYEVKEERRPKAGDKDSLVLCDTDCHCQDGWDLIEPKLKKEFINLTEIMPNLQKELLDKDTQMLVEAGLLNKSLEITSAGSDELKQLLFLENKAKLVKVAETIVAEKAKTVLPKYEE